MGTPSTEWRRRRRPAIWLSISGWLTLSSNRFHDRHPIGGARRELAAAGGISRALAGRAPLVVAAAAASTSSIAVGLRDGHPRGICN